MVQVDLVVQVAADNQGLNIKKIEEIKASQYENQKELLEAIADIKQNCAVREALNP